MGLGLRAKKFTWLVVLCFLPFTSPALCQKAETFFCQGKWDGEREVVWSFENEGKLLNLALSGSRCRFLIDGDPVGWSELMPSLPNPPFKVTLYRNKFRWLLLAGRRLVAFAFVDVPPTTKWSGSGIEGVTATPHSQELTLVPTGDWQRSELEDGSFAFKPPEEATRKAFPLFAEDQNLTDMFASLDVQPNGARSIGLGFCWGSDGGYLWRWLRRRGEMVWQLSIATPSNSGWEFKVLYEEQAFTPQTKWHQLQVWQSGDQIWVGVDGALSTQVRDNRFGLGQVVVWVESGDLPPPLIKPVRVTNWWCAILSPDIDTYSPFPAQSGKWVLKPDGWVLKGGKNSPATALLGTPDLPSWFVVDIRWQNETVGLVFGWVDERDYYLLRLKPLTQTENIPFPHAVLEIVAVRGSRERVLDSWSVLLERDRIYRLAILMVENRVSGFINGMGLVGAEVSPLGKVGVWTDSSLFVSGFWLYKGSEPLLPLTPEKGGIAQPLSNRPIFSHESVSLTLPAGLPPNVPLSAKLSKGQVMLFVERQGNQLKFRLERQGNFLGTISTPMPSRLPITIRLERRDNLLLVWLGDQPVWTVKLP